MRLEQWIYALPLRWRSLVHRRRVDAELDDEIAYHLAVEIDEQVARGVDPEEARRRALRQFGGVVRAKEECRDTRGFGLVDDFAQDVRYGIRSLVRQRAFALVSILTLALGIGANTAVFSLVDGILLSPLPFPDADRLVAVKASYPNAGFAALRETVRTMDVAAYADGHWLTLTGDGEPERLAVTRVSADLLPVLGVRPVLGRWLRSGEDQAGRDALVVLSHSLWRSRFRSDPAILGRFIVLDGVQRQVVAVMPASFRFPSSRTAAWIPLGIDAANRSRYWGGDYMPIVGRLRPSATMGQALAEVRVFQARILPRFPWPMPPTWNKDLDVVTLEESLVGSVRGRLLILMAAVVLVLVVACANVANLSLSRAAAREREIGIRAAIGAGPRRIARQLLTESVLLAALGAIAGLLFALQAIQVLKLVLPPDTPRLADVRLDWRVLGFTAAVSVAAGCAFGLAPVLHAMRLRLRTAVEGGRDGRTAVAWPLRAGLTIAQIACAVLLVITAGLLARSLWTLSHVDAGFRPDGVITAVVSPTQAVCGTPDRCLAFYRSFEEALESAAGIQSAAFVNTLPLGGSVAKRSLALEGLEGETPLFWLHTISAGYFGALDIRVESGRPFTPAEVSSDAPVAIVSASTASRFWPGESPLGRHVRFTGDTASRRIVGVVADVRGYDLTRHVPGWMVGTVYVPHARGGTLEDGGIPTTMTVVLRTGLRAEAAARLLRELAGGPGGQVAISDVRPMQQVVSDAVAAPAATTSLLVTMAIVALTLGCIGIYGVLSFLVSRRSRDLGIRLALGATRGDVVWLVAKEGATLSIAGIVLGFAGAVALTRWLSSELYGVSPTDPATYLGVALAVSLATFVACWVPTRRATRVDPLLVLRES